MAFLKEWTFCVCCSLIAAVIFSMLAPSGHMNRFYKLLIGLFVLISFLYPFRDFKGIDFYFDEAFPQAEAEERQGNIYQQTAEKQIKAVLTENNIVGVSVTCDVQVDYDSGEIRLNAVQIAVPDEYDCDVVGDLLFQKLGVKAKVIHLGE